MSIYPALRWTRPDPARSDVNPPGPVHERVGLSWAIVQGRAGYGFGVRLARPARSNCVYIYIVYLYLYLYYIYLYILYQYILKIM
jgi:hypothetical protein